MPITPQSRVKLLGGLLAAEVDRDMIVMSVRHDRMFGFNATGNLLWPRLADWTTVGDLRDALAERFDAAPSVIEADLIAFLDDLARHGFVEVAA